MANTKTQGKQSAPRYASIMGQPHMLAYINSDEEKMIRKAGGAGTPGPGGIPAYWTLTEPSTWAGGSNHTPGAGYEGTGNFNASDNVSTTDTGSDTSTGDTTGSDTSTGSTEWTTTNMNGVDVDYTGTPGEGDFFVKDTSDIDPYEYVELINADYSDNAAFDMSHYAADEDHSADVAFYKANPTATITTEQYGTAVKISKALSVAVGPLALGYRAIVELQRRGILPGNTATSWFEKNEVSETTGSSNDDLIIQMAEDGATNDEIEDALKKSTIEDSLSNKTDALDVMSDTAFGDSTAEDATTDPSSLITDKLSDSVPTIDAGAEGNEIDGSTYKDPGSTPVPVDVVADDEIKTVEDVVAKEAKGYTASTVKKALDEAASKATGAVGTVGDGSTVDAEGLVIDVESTAKGLNAVGKALNDFASIDTSTIVDTSTVAGKLLADKLGAGGYVDSKSTILGQMKIISDEFKDSSGNPVIPVWAQGTARNVQKTIAFGGMSGTAATAALANAIMEASLGVAEKEATFFQTLTVENLSNKQAALINKATVLANFEMSNLDARMDAAVQNAKAFLQTDLANLANEQQAEILNVENRVSGILEDAKATNAARLFGAQEANDFTTFYAELGFQIEKHRADTVNEMSRFNAGETNDNREFVAELDLNRDKFYKDLSYNIDLSNAKWRNAVTLAEAQMEFDAAKLDTENMFSLTTEALNKVWDREDAYFDFIWKSTETELERNVDLYEIDKEYETEMLKINNAVAASEGAADYELFKLSMDVIDSDIWDVFG